MGKQLIIAGFHRSGTSMLAQEIHNAGLFLGYNLLGADVSNQDGHFEDKDFFTLHDEILQYNQENWQIHNENKTLRLPTYCKERMRSLYQKRENDFSVWGFKDPRSAFFLHEWSSICKNPYVIVIYRHYDECVNSLLTRSSRNIAYNKSFDISFWENPELAYRMWIAYNKKLIEYIKHSPENSLIVSHQSLLNGLDVVGILNEKFDFNLNSKQKKSISKSLVSSPALRAFQIDAQLQHELDTVWRDLESLSMVSNKHHLIVAKGRKKKKEWNLLSVCKTLNISTKTDNKLFDLFIQLQSPKMSLSDKLSFARDHLSLVKNTHSMEQLIDIFEQYVDSLDATVPFYQFLSNLYIYQKEYAKAEYIFLKAFAITDSSIAPYMYDHLGIVYLSSYRFDMALYYIDKAIQKNSKNHLFYFHKATFYAKMYKYKEALKHLTRAIELHPNHVPYYLFQIDLYHFLYQEDLLLETFTLLEKKFPENHMVQNKKNHLLNTNKISASFLKNSRHETLMSLQQNSYFYTHILLLSELICDNIAKENFFIQISAHLEKLKEHHSQD